MNAKTQEPAPEGDAFPGAPHPRFATRLIGHAAAEREALEAYRSGRMPHAWLIGGPESVGKATFAWRLARFVAAHPDPEAPAVRAATDLASALEGASARLIASLAHPDLVLIRRRYDEKRKAMQTQIAADDLRSGLTLFQRHAAFGGWRIAIVDCAEDLNVASANALLKVIEEPPPRALILIVAHRMGAVLPTIRSRCRKVTLSALTPAEIVEVVNGLGPPFAGNPADGIAAAADAAKGSVRGALKRLQGGGEAALEDVVASALAKLPRLAPREADRLASAIAGKGEDDPLGILSAALSEWIVDKARASAPGEAREGWLALWDRLRAMLADADALNLDKRLAARAVLAEIEAFAPA